MKWYLLLILLCLLAGSVHAGLTNGTLYVRNFTSDILSSTAVYNDTAITIPSLLAVPNQGANRLIHEQSLDFNAPSPYHFLTNATTILHCEVFHLFDLATTNGTCLAGSGDFQDNNPPGDWITVDLGPYNQSNITSFNVTFWNYSTSRQYDPTAFKIEGSNDNISFTFIANVTYGGINTTNSPGRTIQLNYTNTAAYEFLRYTILSNAGGNSSISGFSELTPLGVAGFNTTQNRYASTTFNRSTNIRSVNVSVQYGNGAGRNNVSINVSCDGGTTYAPNVTTGSTLCPANGTSLAYVVGITTDQHYAPSLQGLNITLYSGSVLNTFNLSASTITVSTGTLSITMNCSDDLQAPGTNLTITDPNGVSTNFTPANTAGDLFVKNYTPAIAGTYNVTGYCNEQALTSTAGPLSFTATNANGGGGSTGGSGGGSSTAVNNFIVNASSAYQFESVLIDKGLLFMTGFDELPVQFTVPITLNKITASCTATTPFTCAIDQNGTSINVTYTETGHEFLTKTVTGEITAKTSSGELARTTAYFRIINTAYALGPLTSRDAPALFTTFPYLLRVTDNKIHGIRLAAIIVLGLFLLLLLFTIKLAQRKK